MKNNIYISSKNICISVCYMYNKYIMKDYKIK